MRKIPATIVTQHPDHAHTPYWHHRAYITTQDEPRELYLSFSELGAEEYKWDWEGKLVDEAILERLLSEYYEYFKKYQIGIDKFLTFRLPNPKVETEFRLGRAFMGILAASGLTHHLGLYSKPLFEVILPMTETPEEMIAIQEAFHEIASVKHPLLKKDVDLNHIELIPLFEDIETISYSDKILEKYLSMHKKLFKTTPEYIRPYMARSDPALNAGIVPTVLALKIALSSYSKFSYKTGVETYPMIGAAALPFRGGLSPDRIEEFLKEYSGIRTTTIQSAFRYDYPKEDVIAAMKKINKTISKGEPMDVSEKDEKELRLIMSKFSEFYRQTIEEIAPVINHVSKLLPKRRERVQHTGLFGYSRGVGKVKLPRAIGFTASMYSLGVPPELIGTGRGISWAKKHNQLELIEKYYLNFSSDLYNAYKYTSVRSIEALAKNNKGFALILEDYREIEKYLKHAKSGITKVDKSASEHQILSANIIEGIFSDRNVSREIEKAALIRKSLG